MKINRLIGHIYFTEEDIGFFNKESELSEDGIHPARYLCLVNDQNIYRTIAHAYFAIIYHHVKNEKDAEMMDINLINSIRAALAEDSEESLTEGQFSEYLRMSPFEFDSLFSYTRIEKEASLLIIYKTLLLMYQNINQIG